MKKNIKMIIKSLCVVVVSFFMVLDLCACGEDFLGESGDDSLMGFGSTQGPNESSEMTVAVYIVDNTKYSPVYDYEKLFEASITADFWVEGSTAIVIEADKTPRVVGTFVSEGADSLATRSSNERFLGKEAKKVIECMEGVTPDDGELDLIKSINIAFDELSAYGDGVNKKIEMVSSCLNTCNPMDMCVGGLSNIQVDSIVNNLIFSKELKSGMSGISVDLYGVGRVTPGLEQGEPSNPERDGIENLYSSMFTACGVDSCVIHSDTPNGDYDLDSKRALPEVSVVATSEGGNLYSSYTEEEVLAEDFDLCTGYIEFPEGSSLSFKAGSAEYISSQEEVNEILNPVVKWANSNPGETIAIFASTASAGTYDELMTLAEERAKTVRDSLVSLGLDSSRVQVYPLGYEMNPYKYKDTTDEGSFIEDEGKKNRVVYISTVSSTAAEPFFNEVNK